MTDQEREEFLRYMEEFRLKIKGNRELSREFLIAAGIYTEEGVLAEPYEDLYIPRPDEKAVVQD
jgi:hypothetical protein